MVRLGLIGCGRGQALVEYCDAAKNARLTAICDFNERLLKKTQLRLGDPDIQLFTDYHEFLKADFDVVVLANYATEHAPFAIEAMRAGKNVISEVLPVETMSQAVELIEAVEETGKKYVLAENFCYFSGILEIASRYRAGELGSFEYGEGEYLHNCESSWSGITGGDPGHWRNTMSAFYYCSHSVGPLLHVTGLRPVKVSGFECPFNERMARMGAKAGHTAVEIITLENGAVVKSTHGVGPSRSSVFYSFYGSEGRMETAREDARSGDTSRVYINVGEKDEPITAEPDHRPAQLTRRTGHGNADGICLYHAIEHMAGNPDTDIIDVYEAVDMWMPGFFGYLSAMNNNAGMTIPDLRNKAERDAFREDRRCTTPSVAGDQLLPSYSKGNPPIAPEVYARARQINEAYNQKLDHRPQLKMTWHNAGKPPVRVELPEYIHLETILMRKRPVEDWLNLVQYGIVPPHETKACFDAYLTNWPDYDPDLCYFLVNDAGEAIGTVTLIVHKNQNEGDIHMVALLPSYRGRGLGNAMMDIAMNKAKELELPVVRLTTDDWRYSAIRSYLKQGFERDLSTPDYQARWEKIRCLIED